VFKERLLPLLFFVSLEMVEDLLHWTVSRNVLEAFRWLPFQEWPLFFLLDDLA